jgi:heme exporter protein A
VTLTATTFACERNGRIVFSNLSFSIAPGECAELRGANGAGKSSLLRMIAGLVPASAGTLTFNTETDISQHLHFIAHQDAMKSSMTVAENLQFWCAVLGGEQISEALRAFNLEALKDDPVQLLSAGQRRRLSLARLFLKHRPLWLLDEPMTALDVSKQDLLRGHIRKHLDGGGMVLAATHGDLGVMPDQVISLGDLARG